jgi:hypothetical protein
MEIGHIYFVSLAEIQTELKKLTPAELARVETFVREIKTASSENGNSTPGTLQDYWNSLRDTVILKSGWDKDEPLEIWDTR